MFLISNNLQFHLYDWVTYQHLIFDLAKLVTNSNAALASKKVVSLFILSSSRHSSISSVSSFFFKQKLAIFSSVRSSLTFLCYHILNRVQTPHLCDQMVQQSHEHI